VSVASIAARRPYLTIAIHLGLLVAALFGMRRLDQTDDVLLFLPTGNQDVQTFKEISDTFGALDLALVGIEARKGDDIFAPDVLEKIDAVSRALKNVHGVDRVVSLTTLPDFLPSDQMVQIVPLVDVEKGAPRDPAWRKALHDRVMSRDHIVGNFVSRDATATVMLVYFANGVSKHTVSTEVREAALKAAGDLRCVFGGGPFAQTAIYDESQADIRKLTPIAALLILAVILVAFRDPVGVALSVFTVAWSSVLVLGFMGFIHEPFTMISGTIPVILFASGSSYAVHVLGRYYADGGGYDREAPIRATNIVAPPVSIAGATTAAGFVSFMAMDILPMRNFGLESAAGVLLCLFSSVTLVPAVITVWPRKSWKPIDTGGMGTRLGKLTDWARRRRVPILAASVILGGLTVRPMLNVDVKIEPSAFFSKDSDPAKAEAFLAERFGGSRFFQIDFAGDMTDPATLIEVERFAEFARTQPGVTQVGSMIIPFTLVNEAMGNGRRLPENRAQATNLLFFLEGDPSMHNLLSSKRDEALVHVRVRGDVQPTMEGLEDYLLHHLHGTPGQPTPADIVERLQWAAKAANLTLAPGAAEKGVQATLAAKDPPLGDEPRKLAEKLLDGEGGLIPAVTDPEKRKATLDAMLAGDGEKALAAISSPEEAAVAWQTFGDQKRALARDAAVTAGIQALAANLPPDGLAIARTALADLLPSQPIPPSAKPLTARLSGEPLLSRGFSRSVAVNQQRSLIVSLVVVLALMFLLFRSLYLAWVSVLPAALWMAVLFGAMGATHQSIDISTSLVASIATGAGSDFAMHYLWYWKQRSASEAVRFVGPIMVISAVLVSSGFACLALGTSRIMHTFGGLAALAMLGAFGLTFLLVPALLRKGDYRVEAP
jgi:predicted RND superfamily exporter protein